MSSTFKVQVKELSPEFIEDMKEKYGEAELEITVNRKPDFVPLSEADFWKIIDFLDWEKEEDADILAASVEKLSSLPVAHIYGFEDILSVKLFELDQIKYAEQIGDAAYQKDKYFSVDVFLYARACVVANGKETYQTVIANPENMPKNITFEPLLSLAAKAYEKKTGKEFSYHPAHNYETYSNKKGWQ